MREPFCPHCGAIPDRKKRSPQHHRFYFQAIKAAYSQWPHEHRFLPKSEEHLRHWLQVEAGHHDIIGQNLAEDASDVHRMADFAERVLTKAQSSGSAGFVEISGRRSIIAKFPRSIEWKTVSEQEFKPIASAVFDIIHAEIGVSVDDLVRGLDAA